MKQINKEVSLKDIFKMFDYKKEQFNTVLLAQKLEQAVTMYYNNKLPVSDTFSDEEKDLLKSTMDELNKNIQTIIN